MKMTRMKLVVMATMVSLFLPFTTEAWYGFESNGGVVLGARSWSVRAVEQDTAGDLEIPPVLGESLPVIGISEWAFQGCSKLTGVTIPDSVTYISGGAFQDCTGLTRVTIGTNVNTLGISCFQGCTKLQSIEIPDGVASIPWAAFAYCPSLGMVKLGNGVKEVTGSVHSFVMTGVGGQTVNVTTSPFAGCTSLKGIEFGTSIERVDWGAFENCANLKYVYFPGKLPLRAGTMPGVADRVCYVTHEAYPDGLPNPTWSDVPLKYLEGKLPSGDELWDLGFYRPNGWLGSFCLSAETNGQKTCVRFLKGNPIYMTYAFADNWGIAPITKCFTNEFHLVPAGSVHYECVDNGMEVGGVVGRISHMPKFLQGLDVGEYTVSYVLNSHASIPETDYSNNTNSISFAVVPSTAVTFMSEGNVVGLQNFEKGGAYGKLMDAPSRYGYVFLGWFTDADGGDAITETSTVPDSPTTLHAHWQVAVNQTLTVGGTLPPGTTKWTFGNLYKITSNLVVPSGATLEIEPGVIVKFDVGRYLSVANGGALKAIGTRALPIVFTSIKDDANGGDANDDGDVTMPQPGDWVKIGVNGGTATFDYAKILYSSRNATTGAINMNGGTVMFDNGEIAHCAYDAVGVEDGNCCVRNTAIHDCLLAFRHWTKDPIVNCVIYDCGRLTQGGGQHFYNCIFSRITETWEAFGFPQNGTTYRNCCFWNEEGSVLTAEGRQDAKEVCGKNGNIWGDPLFVNPEKGDFRIAANSPCVDAGDGAVAPERDYYGSPRMNVNGVRPTGSAAANGAVPDIGIYEVPGDGNVPSVDLTVTAVTAPASFRVGDEVEVSWTVKNAGEETASGMWRDEIEIVAANGQAFPMGTVASQAEIKRGASANFKAKVTVPAAPDGAVQVRVTANKYQDLFEAMRSENNIGTAAATLTVPMIAVPADGTATTVTLGGDSDIGFALDGGGAVATQGGVLVIRGAGELDAWLGNGAIAAKDNAIRTAVKIADDTWLLQIPKGSEPRVTVRNDGDDSAAVNLSLEIGELLVLDAVITKYDPPPSSGVTYGSHSAILEDATVTVRGNGFNDSVSCWLEIDGKVCNPIETVVDNEMTLSSSFSLPARSLIITPISGANQNPVYVLHVKKGNQERSIEARRLPGDTGSGAVWYGEVDVPDVIRSGRSYVGTFRYGNRGGGGIRAPYVSLTAKGDTLIRLSESDAWSKSVSFMAASDTYPASILKAGESSKVTFLYKTTGKTAEIEYALTQASDVDVPWNALMEAMRPSWATDELWQFASETLADKISYWDIRYYRSIMMSAKSTGMEPYDGSTGSDEHKLSWTKVLNCLRYNCDHLMKVGMPEKRVDRLWLLELNDAMGYDLAIPKLVSATDLYRSARGLGISLTRHYSASLSGRFANRISDGSSSVGRLGYGWADNFSTYAERRDENTVVFHLPSGGSYSFSKVSGIWKPEDARDKTILTETDDSYLLGYSSGTVQTFAKSNMKTSSIRDIQGNELTFTYSGNNIEKVQHSDGQFLSFTYSRYLLSQISDDQGRVTTYGYTRDFLTSVTSFNGLVTRYEYITDRGKPTNRALSKITYPDGTTREFAYDENGRVVSTSVNGGQLKTQIVRGDFGCYSLVAPDGGVTDVTVGANGEVLKVVNALGETVKLNRTADSLLESVVAPSGKRSKITYNNDGSPIAAMSASGASTAFSYEPDFGNLASVTDAKGHALNYSYDELGRGTAASYADGSSSTREYNDKGDVVRSTNRRSETIEYEYDAEGNLVKKTWPNGRTFTLAYDAKGNVTNAADSVTGAVTMEYDANERLVRIVYPKGRGFTYSYDAAGRVTERTMLRNDGVSAVAQDKQRYTYDSLGRLSRVAAGDNTPYLINAYDPTTGWLITQTYGNGTVVSNAYDMLGRTIGIYHLRRDRVSAPYQRIAFFEYEYDQDGKCISQTTAEGTESYTYDADGQLTGVTYPDGTSETFTYDAVGNRMESRRLGGGISTYTVNNLNQYTSISGGQTAVSAITYDLDGNLTSRTDADGTTTYAYDTLNRLVAVTNEAKNIRWSCEYDVFGNRVSVTDNGTTTERLFVQGSLPSVAAEYNDNTLTKSHVLVGVVRLADITGGSPSSATVRYYHSDLLGSARLLTDGTGATKGTRSFKAFGQTRTSTGETTDAGYVGTLGVETDSNGLLFMRNRYYDAGIGRFVQMDPIGLKGGDANCNRYCVNNPVNSIDYDGLNFMPTEYKDPGLVGPKDVLLDTVLSLPGAGVDKLYGKGTINAIENATLSYVAGIPGMGIAANDSYNNSRNNDTLHTVLAYTDWVKWGLSLCYWPLPLAYDGVNLTGQEIARAVYNPPNLIELADGLGHLPGDLLMYAAYKIYCLFSRDPNEISGPLGMGEKRYVKQGEWMSYTIYFENKTNATAAAQEVFVDLPMDENLDWTTLELGEIAFGEHLDTSLVGESPAKKARLQASYAMPGTNTSVKTEVKMKDGVLSWYMRDWDPTTADNFPASATGGFLPPNDDTGRGEGHLSFRVRVGDNAPNGAVINASAQIVFDSNPMIETDPSWWNTVGGDVAVAFVADGVVVTNVSFAIDGTYGELPSAAAPEGMVLDGWFTGEGGTGTRVSADDAVSPDIETLYAAWRPAVAGTVAAEAERTAAGGVMRMMLHRTGGSDGRIAVKVKTQTSTGICGTDFAYVKDVLVWEDGDASDKVIEIPTYASGAGKSLRVKLATLTTGTYEGCATPALAESKVYAEMAVPSPGTVAVTAPTPLSVVGGSVLRMTLSRTGGSDGKIAVKAKTQTSTALMGVNGSADFDYVKKVFEWADGDATDRYLDIPTYIQPWEGTRALRVKLATLATGAYAGNLVPKLAEAKIYADIENPSKFGTVSVASSVAQPRAGEPLRLVFRRTGGSDWPIAVKYKVQTSTALAGTDFEYTKGVVTWADGEGGEKAVEVTTYPSAAGKQLRVKLSTLTQGAYEGCVTPHVKEAKVYVPLR